jgi:pimeloyl-ACP methyl ester carboxylesterase
MNAPQKSFGKRTSPPQLPRPHVAPPAAPASQGRRLWRGALLGLVSVLGLLFATLAGFRGAAAWRETETAEALAPKTGQFVETPTGRVFVQDSGPRDGIPVVLIHGTAAWSEFWRGTIDHLNSQRYRVIAVDLPPFGFSDRSTNADYSRAAQTERIIGALDALKIDRALFVGHSFGAGATVETVMRHPARVRGLVLVAGALNLPAPNQPIPPAPAAIISFLDLPVLPELLIAATATNPMLSRRLLGTMVARKEAATPELAAVLQRPMRRRGTTREFAIWAKAFLTPDLAAQSMQPDAYKLIAVKTRLIWGDLDTLTPLQQGRRLEALIPGASLSLMPGVGHIPQIEGPDNFRPLLVQLLRDVT